MDPFHGLSLKKFCRRVFRRIPQGRALQSFGNDSRNFMKLQQVCRSFFIYCVQTKQINSRDDSLSYSSSHHSQRKAKMYTSMKMMCMLHSQSMCQKWKKECNHSWQHSKFSTGLDEEPLLGFKLQPSIQFVAARKELKWSFVPKANTCSKTMFLPRESHCLPLPAEEDLFYVYDAAFSNTYFGLA